MADPYESQSVASYNANPPPDDGSQTEANRLKWATIKTKLSDPLNTFASAVNAAITAAFGKIPGGAGVTSTSTSMTVGASNQGQVIVVTGSGGITITTPDATDVDAPFLFFVSNTASADITIDGSGSQTIDGQANITLRVGGGVTVETDGTNWFTHGQNFQRTQITPQGRLTLTSTAPVLTVEVTAGTSVYYVPYVGDLTPIYNGSVMVPVKDTGKTLTLAAQHLASSIYDVFAFLNPANGAFTIGTGPAWSTVTAGAGARGTGAGTTELVRVSGIWTNANSMTARNGATTYSLDANKATYLGSIFMDGTNGQISCHLAYGQDRKWGVWNCYNRVPIMLRAGDGTASWTYSTSTWRASNNSSSNKVTVFAGLSEDFVEMNFNQKWGTSSAANSAGGIAIGLNSTTTVSGFGPENTNNNVAGGANHSIGVPLSGRLAGVLVQGINNIQALEWGANSGTFYGTQQNMMLTARWMG